MQPLEFHPLLKRIRWGGTRLGTVLGKPLDEATDYAESWELADHREDQTVVVGGPYADWTLGRLVDEKTEELFGRNSGLKQFPLLIKFLDAHDRLSLQVHPNDEQAKQVDPHENGKSEAWIIIEAEPESRLFAGLKKDVDRNRLLGSLADGTVEDCVHAFRVTSGDCVHIPAGTVHAIGAGILLAEIQQSSDLTYRLYDWGRMDSDGKPRELHVAEAIECIDFDRGPVEPLIPRSASTDFDGVEELVRSEHFVIRRHTTRTNLTIAPEGRFQVLMLLKGNAEFICGDDCRRVGLGQTVLLPASAAETQIVPSQEIVLLQTFLP